MIALLDMKTASLFWDLVYVPISVHNRHLNRDYSFFYLHSHDCGDGELKAIMCGAQQGCNCIWKRDRFCVFNSIVENIRQVKTSKGRYKLVRKSKDEVREINARLHLEIRELRFDYKTENVSVQSCHPSTKTTDLE